MLKGIPSLFDILLVVQFWREVESDPSSLGMHIDNVNCEVIFIGTSGNFWELGL